MKETFKYIKVLNWFYSSFATMALNKDYEKSIRLVQERLDLLESLDGNALFCEARSPNGRANLLKYLSTEDSIEYDLHFMRDRGQLLEALQPDYYEKEGEKVVLKKNTKRMIRPYLNRIDKYRANGLWTDEQWREYRVTLSQVERDFELGLKLFETYYDIENILHYFHRPVEDIEIEHKYKVRLLTACTWEHIKTIGQLFSYNPKELRERVRWFGQGTINAVESSFKSYGISWCDNFII